VYQKTTGDIDILIATPGRLLDLLTSHSHAIDLRCVTYFVLDEGDKMLDLGFTEQITAIAAQIRPDRQTLLFSATFPGRLREIADTWMGDKSNSVIIRCSGLEMNSNPNVASQDFQSASAALSLNICDMLAAGDASATAVDELLNAKVAGGEDTDDQQAVSRNIGKQSTLTVNRAIQQSIHVCATHKKPRLLLRFIESIREKEKLEKTRQPAQILIFCNKTKSIGFVLDFLKKQNIMCDKLCGSMAQEQRERALANFKAVSPIFDGYFCYNCCNC